MNHQSVFTVRRVPRVWLLAAGLAVLSLSGRAEVHTNRTPSRYLFVVETSSAVRRQSENIQGVVGQLLLSGLSGQLQTGDSIGVWTYNDKLHANFPLQTWSPAARKQIAAAVVDHLKKQKSENSSHLENVIPQLNRLVKESDKFTVLLISDGGDKVSGTPYDEEINTVFESGADDQRSTKMPFITVLRSIGGEYLGYRVNFAPWPVEFPTFPPEPVVVAKPAPPPPKPRMLPPLIVINTNSSTAPNAPSPTVLPQPVIPSKQANLPPEPGPRADAPHGHVISSPLMPETEPPPATASASLKSEVSSSEPKAQNSELDPQNLEPTTTAAMGSSRHSDDYTEAKLPPAAVHSETSSPEPTASAPSEAVMLAAASGEEENSPERELTSTGSSGPPVQLAASTPGISKQAWLLAGGALLLGIALGGLFVTLKRSHSRTRPSLITRSLDRDSR